MELLTENQIIASILVVGVAAVIQGSMGMGFGQIAASGLIWIEPMMVPTAVIVMGFCVALTSAVKEFDLIDPKQLQPALMGRLIGTIASIPLIVWVGNQGQFGLLFGALVLVGIGVSLTRASPALSKRTLVIGGIASGVMGTITSIGAPPMGLIYQGQTASKVRATLNAFFAIGSLISLAALWYSGLFAVGHLLSAAILAPGFLAGVYASRGLGAFVDRRDKALILLFCGASAVALMGKSLWMLSNTVESVYLR